MRKSLSDQQHAGEQEGHEGQHQRVNGELE